MEHEICHFPENFKFETVVDGHACYVRYCPCPEGIKITSTYVPQQVEGRGIAAALVKSALDYAACSGFKVVPLCSYVVAYIKRHPEYSHLL